MALCPDVTELLDDPDLGAQEFSYRRRTIEWQGGRAVVATDETFSAVGNIQPASAEQLDFLPEGEKRKGAILIYTRTMLHLSEGEDVSDDVTWQGEAYKVIHVDRWVDYGFYVAYAQKR